jgi:hypothetical protein
MRPAHGCATRSRMPAPLASTSGKISRSPTRLTGGSPAQRAARQAQAQTYAGDIRRRAAQLVGLDQQVAGEITAAVAGIRHTFPQNPSFGTPPKDNRVHAVDNHTFKQRPPPPLYPVNEVIAEATDLDGNHVVLRRGYYDEDPQ